MKKISMFVFSLFIGGVLALTSCGAAGNPAALTANSWKLVSYGPISNPVAAVSNANTSLDFGKDGKFNCNVGCNSFGGDFTISGDQITFGPVVRTMMACDGQVMQQEDAVMLVFSGIVKFSIESGKLTINSTKGDTAVTFVPDGK
jgi:heat shock protein HslJ